MIHKLKRRFTLLATATMALLVAILLLIINLVNYSLLVSETESILDVLSQPNIPDFIKNEEVDKETITEPLNFFMPPGMSGEVLFESRFFTVMESSEGKVEEPDFSRITMIDSRSSEKYVRAARESKKNSGFVGQFRYKKTSFGKKTRILFLDCGRKLDAFYSFLRTSVGVGVLGCVAMFFVFFFASGRIIKPIAESYEKQKRFISDAGHEIKTPLTIINANVDILEGECDREELEEIRGQIFKLTDLTNHLVLLSKMEEEGHQVSMSEFSLSELVEKNATTFRPLAAATEITFDANLEPGVMMNGSKELMDQLLVILLDNAVKYTPTNGHIDISLTKGKKNAVLTVGNTTSKEISEKELTNVFERFYRMDASRNSSTGGHGIGLSIAKAIVETHKGSIQASTKTGFDFHITMNFPL